MKNVITVFVFSLAPIYGMCQCEIYGKIKVVDSFEDYKVKVVDSFEDFTVKFVDSFEGCD